MVFYLVSQSLHGNFSFPQVVNVLCDKSLHFSPERIDISRN